MSARIRSSAGVRDGSVPHSVPHSLLARRRRPRVSALLDRTLRPTTRLTLVSAPPGYGKSVAVAGWTADSGLDCAWIELDAEGGDPTVLAARLLGAMEPFRPGAERARTLAGGGGIDARGLAALVRRSVESDDRELVMVLDDFHAGDSPDATLFIGALLRRMPPFGHLVLVTREDPQLPLARLRAHAELVEVRADDLRFSADEGHAFLADLGLEVDTAVADGLIAATEGWPAALQLAALAARSRPEAASIASAGSRPGAANIASAHSRPAAAKVLPASNRYLVDYLADEVMAALDPDTSAAIERLAVADRFSVGLAEALTGRPDTATLLDRLERDNLFLVALDAERRWFRLHALFAAYLQDRLSSEARADLQRAAARWFVREGMPRDAIRHALAGDDPMAIDLIRAEGRGALEAGELRTLAGWLDGLGPATVAADVELAALDAWSRFYTGDLAGSGAAVDPGPRRDADDERAGPSARPRRVARHHDRRRRRGDGARGRGPGRRRLAVPLPRAPGSGPRPPCAGRARAGARDPAGGVRRRDLHRPADGRAPGRQPARPRPGGDRPARRSRAGGTPCARRLSRPGRLAADRLVGRARPRDRPLRGWQRRRGAPRARARGRPRRRARDRTAGPRLGAARDCLRPAGDRRRRGGARHPRRARRRRARLSIARRRISRPGPARAGRPREGSALGRRGRPAGTSGLAAVRHAAGVARGHRGPDPAGPGPPTRCALRA